MATEDTESSAKLGNPFSHTSHEIESTAILIQSIYDHRRYRPHNNTPSILIPHVTAEDKHSHNPYPTYLNARCNIEFAPIFLQCYSHITPLNMQIPQQHSYRLCAHVPDFNLRFFMDSDNDNEKYQVIYISCTVNLIKAKYKYGIYTIYQRGLEGGTCGPQH